MPESELSFEGLTYVAFSDLCGFKQLMKNRQDAYKALNHLYNSTYELLDNNHSVTGLAFSDCVISWANNQQLQSIIDFTARLHRRMIERRYLVKTTIGYGDFQYRNRFQLPNLRKEMIIGGAYITAYLANEKIHGSEGQVLLCKEDLPTNIPNQESSESWRWEKKTKYWEYFWSASSADNIRQIKNARKKANKAKYERLKDIYQGGSQGDL